MRKHADGHYDLDFPMNAELPEAPPSPVIPASPGKQEDTDAAKIPPIVTTQSTVRDIGALADPTDVSADLAAPLASNVPAASEEQLTPNGIQGTPATTKPMSGKSSVGWFVSAKRKATRIKKLVSARNASH